ncbi:MAG: TonB-dependent receptor [Cytophagaceae bacterium]|jgi:hypothetical protein|nr:TonB-dependent receptor [Cytophagaceae bacterium]
MKKIIGFSILFACFIGQVSAQTKYKISGVVSDTSGMSVIGAILFAEGTSYGTTTDVDGKYVLELPAGTYTLVINYTGFKTVKRKIVVAGNQTIDFQIEPTDVGQAVIITGEKPNQNVDNTSMGVTELTIDEIKKMPALFGEVDILKNIQTLPGVQVAGEGNTGLYVRGGGADQNLILIDEAPLYNAAHLFGIFSIFNADAISTVELYKAGVPSQYGGRLSSLLDVRTKSGNMQKFSANGGIGTVASRLTLEGPIIKDKLSYVVSGRRSYADLFLLLSPDEDVRSNKLYFYDLNGRMDFKLNARNSFYVSSYYGRDRFKFADVFQQRWGNATLTTNWKHVASDKLIINTYGTYSNYRYLLGINSGSTKFDYETGIREYALKVDFNYLPNSNHNIHYGVSFAQRTYDPGKFTPKEEGSVFKPIQNPNYYSIEGALFASNIQKVSEKISLDYGLRLNWFAYMGKGVVYSYNGSPSTGEVIDTTTYKSGELIKDFWGLEPRAAVRYLINDQSSVKIGYNRNIQYLTQISNSLSPVPFDIWVPASVHFKPQISDQIAAGYFRNLKDNMFETSVEVYYKYFQNAVDYKDNADILLNPNIESQVRTGIGWSYGAEFFLKKKKGDLTGWVSYTLSWSYRKIDGINNGEKYFAGFDRRHNINIVGAYKINDRWDISANWVFGTGRPIGIPNSGYDFDYFWLGIYPERNSFRLPSYHRFDISATLKQKKKIFKTGEGSWNFSIYNLYGAFRINPFTVITNTNEEGERYFEAIYFPAPIPSVTYNFKF